jgi:hypothetical protein
VSIVSPIDTIQITINNLHNPPKVEMAFSRPLPVVYGVNILAKLNESLTEQAMRAGMPPPPAGTLQITPPETPSNGHGN